MIIGTAGHIDHGKSALVTALTGRTMDRLAEEKRRGITIELNFAPLLFEGLPPAGIVDVPGHEDFVRTMVAGATGVDLVLLVVDAVEGLRPQTYEHLAIVEQLRVPRGIPVITKADLADREWIALVAAELEERLAESPVRFEATAVVSAVTGEGIPALRERLRAHVGAAVVRGSDDGFRLPIDRAFSLAGIGTIVTGTAWSGLVHVGESVVLLPSGRAARVRSIESYGAARDISEPGTRTAIGLVGIDRGDVGRGDALVDQRLPWRATRVVDAVVSLLAQAAAPLDLRRRVRVHLGTAELIARAYPRGVIRAGQTGLVRLALERGTLARGGDRFVLRSYSPVTTIGGGRVVDPWPPRKAPWPEGLAAEAPTDRLGALLARRPWGIAPAELPLLLGLPEGTAEGVASATAGLRRVGDHWCPSATIDRLTGETLDRVGAHHASEPGEKGLSLETLRRSVSAPDWAVAAVLEDLVGQGRLRIAEGVAVLPGFRARFAGGEETLDRVVDAVRSAGLEPPTVAELEAGLRLRPLASVLRHAAETGTLVAVERDRYFSREAMERFAETVRQVGMSGEITPAALRERLGVSRKFLIPLLEWSDRQGITWRDAAGRRGLRPVPGHRP